MLLIKLKRSSFACRPCNMFYLCVRGLKVIIKTKLAVTVKVHDEMQLKLVRIRCNYFCGGSACPETPVGSNMPFMKT